METESLSRPVAAPAGPSTPEAAAAFAALGSAARLQVLLALVRAGPEGRSTGALAERCAMPPSTLSFHLKALVQTGLVEQRREGRHLICTAQTGAIRALSDFLLNQCCAEATRPGPLAHRPKESGHG